MKQIKHNLNALLTLTTTLLVLLFSITGASSAEGIIENGKKIYDRNCMECHHTDGKGILAPPFVESTRFKSMDGVTALIDYIMPANTPDLCTGSNADDVAAYVANQFKFQAPKEMIEPETVTDEAGRKALFDQNCSVCHGVDGKGDLAKSITGSTLFKARKDVVKFIDTLMPFHKPSKCRDACSEQAAHYIIDNFKLKLSEHQ